MPTFLGKVRWAFDGTSSEKIQRLHPPIINGPKMMLEAQIMILADSTEFPY